MTQPEIAADHAGRGPAVPHRLRAQRRRLVARREQARHAGRLARARRRLLGGLQGRQRRRRPRHLGHRRRARQHQRLRRDAVPAQHRARRGARPVPDPRRRRPRRPAQVRATGQDWAFAPTLAVVRDDRWGRTYEGFSEDPRITRAYGYEAIRGLQGTTATASATTA